VSTTILNGWIQQELSFIRRSVEADRLQLV
jgi:hypothetical protein